MFSNREGMRIHLLVDKQVVHDDGTHDLYFNITADDGKRFRVKTDIRCEQKPVGLLFPRTERNSVAKSARLRDLYDQIEAYALQNPHMRADRLKDAVLMIVKGRGVAKHGKVFADYILEFAETKDNRSTRILYELTHKKVVEFDALATFSTIDEQWLEDFERHYKAQGMSVNGIAQQLRNIRAVFNFCRKRKYTQEYPFLTYRIKEEVVSPNSLTVDQLRTLRDYPCEAWQEIYRDLFMLSFYLGGVNAGDLLLCRGLKNGRFVEKRQKTGELIDVPVCDEAMRIIEKYKGKNYLLNVMDGYKDYHDFTSRWDRALKKIGTTEIVPDRVGRRRKVVYHPLFPSITTYTARYTFASIAANDCEIPTETIGKCLAHAWSKNTVTARYISDDRRKVDQAFALVLDKVRG